ncbi:LlaJI family restriction endonuclease [Mucilaginibacter sp.]
MFIGENGILYLIEQVEDYEIDFLKIRLGNLFDVFLQSGFMYTNKNVVNFSYVGVASNANGVICVLPKYLHGLLNNSEAYSRESRKLVQILKQYELNISNANSQHGFYGSSTISETNEIALADFILNDYLRNGIWSYRNKYITTEESNEVLWDYTVDRSTPVISKYPYYFDIYSEAYEKVSNTIISKIHLWAVQYSSERYADLLDVDIFVEGYEAVLLDEVGEADYLIALLNNELRITFNDRNISLLKALTELIKMGSSSVNNDYSLYGKNKFEHIWEDAISYNFKNEYKKYSEHISKPIWRDAETGLITEKHTLAPDVIRWIKDETNSLVLIIDAKYYLFRFNTINIKAENNPGVSDIVKQYFYELVLNRPSSSAPWLKFETTFINILMYPGTDAEKSPIENIGSVSLDNSGIKKPILNFHINPHIIFENYIKRKPFSDPEIAQLYHY